MQNFTKHLALAHSYWASFLNSGDWVLDATAGNGHDTAFLAQAVGSEGRLWSIDIQESALKQTKARCEAHSNITYLLQSHAELPEETKGKLKLIVYNLGYLPGSDKSVRTLPESTMQSLSQAMDFLADGGLISLTAYPGHEEGAAELEELEAFFEKLPAKDWTVCQHRWLNRKRSPQLFLILKNSIDNNKLFTK